jgi:hypothetical protein
MLMNNKHQLFYKLDILSNPPYLRIFGNHNYKTTWSTYISILVIVFSAGFASYSSIYYAKFLEPNIYYWKNSAYEKNLSIKLNETLIMFRIYESTENNFNKNEDLNIKAYMHEHNFNASYENNYDVTLEKCRLGDNINYKFESTIRQYKEKHKDKSIHDFYCISRKDAEKYSLSYNQYDGYTYLTLFLYSNNISLVEKRDYRIYLVLQNDFVNHTNKNRPININYIESYSSNFDDRIVETTIFDLDYIEYDSNDGLFFDTLKTYHGIRLHGQSQELFFKKKDNINYIGAIKIQININTFEKFKRYYSKLQILLAEIESISSLLFTIGGILANLIAKKKMSIDLTRMIMKKKTEINKGDFELYKTSPTFNEIFGDIEDIRNPKYKFKRTNSLDNFRNTIKTSFSSRQGVKSFGLEKKDSKAIRDKQIIKDVILKNIDNNLDNELKMKKITYSSIIRSYFPCFKDKKTELINLCHSIILNELSIDTILIRLFKLEKIYNLLSENDKAKIHLMEIKEMEEINNYLNKKFLTVTEEKDIIKSDEVALQTNDEKSKK